jgi:hypothetical protein
MLGVGDTLHAATRARLLTATKSWFVEGFVFGSAGRGQTGSNAQAFTGQPAGEGLRPSPHRDSLGVIGWVGRTQLGIRCDPPQVGEAQQ